MKAVTFLAAAISITLAGCATTGVTVSVPPDPKQPVAESAPQQRDKEEAWHPKLTVENLENFDEQMFTDLRRNFIEVLAQSPYRYAIDSITLSSDPAVDKEWTLVMGLDDGSTVRVDHFVEWNEARRSYFTSGLKKALAGLKQVGRKDRALGRYVAYWSKPHKAKDGGTGATESVAVTEVDAPAQGRLGD